MRDPSPDGNRPKQLNDVDRVYTGTRYAVQRRSGVAHAEAGCCSSPRWTRCQPGSSRRDGRRRVFSRVHGRLTFSGSSRPHLGGWPEDVDGDGIISDSGAERIPVLIKAVGDHGTKGYVRFEDLEVAPSQRHPKKRCRCRAASVSSTIRGGR